LFVFIYSPWNPLQLHFIFIEKNNQMAKTNGTNGRFSGKVGNIVGAEWNGVFYIRALPSKNNKPATRTQQVHRRKFALASAFNRKLRTLRELSYGEVPFQTGASLAQKYIFQAMEGTGAEARINFSRLLLASGPLAKGEEVTVILGQPGTILFRWKTKGWSKTCRPDDKAILIAYSEDAAYPDFVFDGPARHTGEARLQIRYSKGETIHTWLAFRSADGKMRSDSVYGGEARSEK
jgi:hypothetical protein